MKRTSDPHQIKEENKKKKKIIFCFPRVGWAEWHRVLVWRPCTYNVYCRLGSSASILRGCRDQLNGCEISSSAGAAVPTSVSAAPNPKRRRAVPAKSTMKILDCHRHFFLYFFFFPFWDSFRVRQYFGVVLVFVCDLRCKSIDSFFFFFFFFRYCPFIPLWFPFWFPFWFLEMAVPLVLVFRLFISPLPLPFFISFLKTRTKHRTSKISLSLAVVALSTGEKRKRNKLRNSRRAFWSAARN